MNSIPRPARKRIRPRLSARSGRARQATRRSRSFVEHHIQVQHRDAGHALPVGVRARLRVLRRTRSAVLFHRQSGCGRDRNGRNERRRLCRRLVRPRFSSVSAERLIGRPPAQVHSALGTSPIRRKMPRLGVSTTLGTTARSKSSNYWNAGLVAKPRRSSCRCSPAM